MENLKFLCVFPSFFLFEEKCCTNRNGLGKEKSLIWVPIRVIYKKVLTYIYQQRIQYFKRLQWSIYHHLNPQVKKNKNKIKCFWYI